MVSIAIIVVESLSVTHHPKIGVIPLGPSRDAECRCPRLVMLRSVKTVGTACVAPSGQNAAKQPMTGSGGGIRFIENQPAGTYSPWSHVNTFFRRGKPYQSPFVSYGKCEAEMFLQIYIQSGVTRKGTLCCCCNTNIPGTCFKICCGVLLALVHYCRWCFCTPHPYSCDDGSQKCKKNYLDGI